MKAMVMMMVMVIVVMAYGEYARCGNKQIDKTT